LKTADEKGIFKIAFPMMGSGFYGIIPDTSISIMYDCIKKYLSNETKLKEIIICANDNRELRMFSSKIDILKQGV